MQLQKETTEEARKPQSRNESLLRKRRALIYGSVVAAGLLLHFGAVFLTNVIIQNNFGREGNPIYDVVGQWGFVAFGFVSMSLYYFLLWKSGTSIRVKYLCASVLSATAVYDFGHDLVFYLNFASLPWTEITHGLLRILLQL